MKTFGVMQHLGYLAGVLAAGVADIVVFHRVGLPLPDIRVNRCVLYNPEIVFKAKWRSMCRGTLRSKLAMGL